MCSCAACSLTFQDAFLLPGCFVQRGRGDENDSLLGDAHRCQVLHHVPQVRAVLIQWYMLLGVLTCSRHAHLSLNSLQNSK